MTPDYSRLRSVTVRQIVAALFSDGFTLRRQTGAHRHYTHPDGRRVTVSYHHASDTIPLPTLKKIVGRQAQWTGQDLERLGLLKAG